MDKMGFLSRSSCCTRVNDGHECLNLSQMEAQYDFSFAVFLIVSLL